VSRSSQKEEPRETLHNYSIDYIKAIAQVFGWRVRASKDSGSQKGPDLIIEEYGKDAKGKEKIIVVMFVESEVGHDQGGGGEYFDKLVKRLQPYLEKYRKRKVKLFSLVVITNAPKRLAEYVREHRHELSGRLGFPIVEGLTPFIVPALLVREVMSAIFVRAMGAVGLYAPSTPALESY
jgi:hypothetical protein